MIWGWCDGHWEYALRGQGANVLFCDEAAFMQSKLFNDVVLPIFGMKDCRLIMISTVVAGYNNLFTKILVKGTEEMQKPDPFILAYVQTLVCNRCRIKAAARGKKVKDCEHMRDQIPSWKSLEKLEQIHKIMGPELEEIFKNENLGIVDGDGQAIFNKHSLLDLRQALPFDAPEDIRPNFIIIFVDPNAGGPNHTSIVAITRISRKFVVRIIVIVSVPVLLPPHYQ